MDDGGGRDLGGVGDQPQQEVALGDDLIAEIRNRPRTGERRAPPPEQDLQPQAVAGDDLPPEFRVVHAAQIHAGVGRAVPAFQEQHRRHLRQRLEHEDAWHERRPRKVPLKELLVDGDVLDRDETPPRLVLDDRVDEHRRIPVAQPVEENGDVNHREKCSMRNGHC